MTVLMAMRRPAAAVGLGAILLLAAGQIVLNDLAHSSWTIAIPLTAVILPFVAVGALVA
jgi:hypothetical protein